MPAFTPASPYIRQLLIFAVGAFVYVGAPANDFGPDARAAVRDNPIVQGNDWIEIATTDYWAGFRAYDTGADPVPGDRSGLYRPLAVLTYALTYAIAGADPFLYHLLDLLLHAAAALALYHLLCRLTRSLPLSWWSALLFAVHPALSEAVLSAVGRADILAALCAFAALYLHLGATESRAALLGAGLALAAALFCKESAICLPGLILLTDLSQYRTFSRKRYRAWWRRRIPSYLLYALLLGAYLLLRWRVLGGLTVPEIDPLDNPLVEFSLPSRLLNAAAILLRYIGLFLLPAHLSADYSFAALPLIGDPLSWATLPVLLALLALAVLLKLAWRFLPWLAFGLSWFLLSIAPVANILLPIGTAMAERLLYLPAAGLCLGLAALLTRPFRYARLLPACGGLLLLLFAGRTFERVAVWRDDYALYGQAVRDYPGSARAWRLFGRAALARGEDSAGLDALTRALEILPDYYEVHDDLGVHYYAGEEFERARRQFEAALAIREDYPPLWLNLGLSLYRLGDLEAAQSAIARAILLDPRYVKAHYDLGVLLLARGDARRAALSFENVLALDPDHEQARHNLEKLRAAGR